MSLNLIKKGNAKIHKSCNVFNLPTSVCGMSCIACYAKRAEIRFPKALAHRQRNYEATTRPYSFIVDMHNEITDSKNLKMRIHESGDFYSDAYVGTWINIVNHHPKVKFYAYTKRPIDGWLASLSKLPNMNLISSITPLGYNYGNQEYCHKLVSEYGYTLCPCKKGAQVECMKDCEICLTNDKVCFLQH